MENIQQILNKICVYDALIEQWIYKNNYVTYIKTKPNTYKLKNRTSF